MSYRTIVVDASLDVVRAALQRLGMVARNPTAGHLSTVELSNGIGTVAAIGTRRTRIVVSTEEETVHTERLAARLRGYGFRVVEGLDGGAEDAVRGAPPV